MEETNKWLLEPWENINGKSPVRDFFEKIRNKDKVLSAQIFKRISYLCKKRVSDLQRSKDFEIVKTYTELYEFKVHAKQEFRILGVLKTEDVLIPIFYALHAFIKKDQKIMKKEISTAIIRLEEFKK